MRDRRRVLVAPDPGLQVRMVGALVLTPLVVVAAAAAVAVLLPLKMALGLAGATAFGVVMALRAERGRETSPTPREQAPELHAIVDRLSIAADIPRPAVVVEDERQPNSWVAGVRRGHARLHVTRGLIDALDHSELEAVVGHELAHLAHRDAAVMTAASGPGTAMLDGGRSVLGMGWIVGVGGFLAMAIGAISQVGSRALSRYREFAADAGSAALTGRPAALASALMKVSAGITAIPTDDLREVAGRDAFHLLPVREHDGTRLMATHPDLRERIARLERLEARLQHARPVIAPER